MISPKYTYETSFDKAIEYGIDKNEYSREASKLTVLTWIANELAEANRIKRLQLKGSSDMKYCPDDTRKEIIENLSDA